MSWRSEIRDLAASEGVFTSAQARRLGIPADALSYGVRAGYLERIVIGAYRLVGAGEQVTDELAALWKLTNPTRFYHERMAQWDGVAVGGTSAAAIHGIGDFFLAPYRIYTPTRFNSRRKDVRFTVRTIDRSDVQFIAGCAVTTPERTIEDLIRDREDPSLVEKAAGAVNHWDHRLLAWS